MRNTVQCFYRLFLGCRNHFFLYLFFLLCCRNPVSKGKMWGCCSYVAALYSCCLCVHYEALDSLNRPKKQTKSENSVVIYTLNLMSFQLWHSIFCGTKEDFEESILVTGFGDHWLPMYAKQNKTKQWAKYFLRLCCQDLRRDYWAGKNGEQRKNCSM